MNRSLNNWIYSMVRAKNGDVGTIEQFHFDDLTWTLRYMTVKTGRWLPGRHVLIPLAALGTPDWKRRVFPVNLTRAQIRNSPGTDLREPVSPEREAELNEHYGWLSYWQSEFYVSDEQSTPTALPDATDAVTPSARLRRVDPHLHSTLELTACRVHATNGNIGHVDDILFDDETWAIRYLVVNTRNWLPDRWVLVSPHWIRDVDFGKKKVLVDLSRSAIKKSPRFDPAKPVSFDYEGKLLDHFKKHEVPEWVVFKYQARRGAQVYVAGTFNQWDPKATRLGDNGKGIFTAMVHLPLGRYEYKFVVNGEWRNNPECSEQVPNAFGTTNCVLVVRHTPEHEKHVNAIFRPPFSEGRRMWLAPAGG